MPSLPLAARVRVIPMSCTLRHWRISLAALELDRTTPQKQNKDLDFLLSPCFYWWASRESNTAPTDYESLMHGRYSPALPSNSRTYDNLISFRHALYSYAVDTSLTLREEQIFHRHVTPECSVGLTLPEFIARPHHTGQHISELQAQAILAISNHGLQLSRSLLLI